MGLLLEKVDGAVPNICGIEIATSGSLKPSSIEGYQEFYNSIPVGTNFAKAYTGKASVSFDEQSLEDNAGISYKQKLIITFPATDKDRANRFAFLQKTRFVKILLTNNKHIVIGRNDFEQNARPKVTVKSNVKLAQAEFETVSIFPSGYVPAAAQGGLPTLFPINFINSDN